MIIAILLAIVVILILVMVYALCAVAGAADEAMERMLDEMKARKE